MEGALDILRQAVAGICLLAGSGFYVLGMVGVIRFPDVFTRMHALSVAETLGAGLLLIGMMILGGLTLVSLKLFVILMLLLFAGPVISHALARAALHDGQKPLLADEDGRLREVAPEELFPTLRDRLQEPLVSETANDDTAEPEGGVPSNS